jgi:hypothetical protein
VAAHAQPLVTLGAQRALYAGTLLGKLCRYHYLRVCRASSAPCRFSPRSEDIRLKLLAAHLLSAPFSVGLPHPPRPAEFGAYAATVLVPGVDLFSDNYQYASSPTSLLRSAECASGWTPGR